MFVSPQPQMNRARRIAQLIRGIPATDGAGVKLNRVIGTVTVTDVNPFLMLDELRSDDAGGYIAGFPDHPHRGFETITYMLQGQVRHRDNKGNEGLVGPGGVQWMTAGRGLIHSEMPEQIDGHMHGFQMWLNLPASEKMQAPKYADIAAEDIPGVVFKNAEVKVLAGRYHGLMGPIAPPTTQPFIVDVSLGVEADITLPIPEDHTGLVYVYEGAIAVEQNLINRGQAGLLEGGNVLNLVSGGARSRALVMTAKPLNEPIVRHGPFVMNTNDEIRQAFFDYQNGQF